MHKSGKPIGLMCISPVMLPKLLGKPIRLTIGNDPDTIDAIEIMGGSMLFALLMTLSLIWKIKW